MRETGTGQQVAQLHDRYMLLLMMMMMMTTTTTYICIGIMVNGVNDRESQVKIFG